MATQFCQKCKQSHPGRVCDYDENGECSETAAATPNSSELAPVEEREPSSRREQNDVKE